MGSSVMRLKSAVRAAAFFCLPFLASGGAWARAYFAPLQNMIEDSEIIAVFDVEPPERVDVQGGHWQYSQQAKAKMIQLLKGVWHGEIILLGRVNFDSAQNHWKPGRHLLFLQAVKGQDAWTSANWHPGIRPMRQNADGAWEIEWLDGTFPANPPEWISVDEAARRVQGALAQAVAVQEAHKRVAAGRRRHHHGRCAEEGKDFIGSERCHSRGEARF